MSLLNSLTQVIKDRPIGILGSGTSITQLKYRIKNECYKNVCWVCVNNYSQLRHIIKPYKFDIVMATCRQRYNEQREYLLKNKEFTLIAQIEERKGTINPYGDSRFVGEKFKKAHSMSYLIYILNELEYKDIYLFGMDGGWDYYKDLKVFDNDRYKKDCNDEFEFIRETDLKCLNVSEGSNYPIKIISYNEAERRLNEHKR